MELQSICSTNWATEANREQDLNLRPSGYEARRATELLHPALILRRMWDSNPRTLLHAWRFSRPFPSSRTWVILQDNNGPCGTWTYDHSLWAKSSNQLRAKGSNKINNIAAKGIEPPTSQVWTGRSSQLSYTRHNIRKTGSNLRTPWSPNQVTLPSWATSRSKATALCTLEGQTSNRLIRSQVLYPVELRVLVPIQLLHSLAAHAP